MSDKENKVRTTITISPTLWEQCKTHCDAQSATLGRRYSFSEFVEEALKTYLKGPAE